jgi:hypothetical protein
VICIQKELICIEGPLFISPQDVTTTIFTADANANQAPKPEPAPATFKLKRQAIISISSQIHPHRPQFASFRSSQCSVLFPPFSLACPCQPVSVSAQAKDRKFDEPKIQLKNTALYCLYIFSLSVHNTPQSSLGVHGTPRFGIPGSRTTINPTSQLYCPCIGSSRLTNLAYARQRHAADTTNGDHLSAHHDTNGDFLRPTLPPKSTTIATTFSVTSALTSTVTLRITHSQFPHRHNELRALILALTKTTAGTA